MAFLLVTALLLPAMPCFAVEPLWSSLGPASAAGRVLSLAFDPANPGALYAGAAGGGVWWWGGAEGWWLPLGDSLPSLAVGAVAVSPRDPRVLIAGTGDPSVVFNSINGVGILRSTDGGATWRATNAVLDRYAPLSGYRAIEANPATGVFLAAGTGGLMRSEDDGRTWSAVGPPGTWSDVQWRPGSADSAFAILEFGGVYGSADGGRTFQPITAGLPPASSISGFSSIACSPSDPRVVYAGICAPDSFALLGIYRSTDGGATWELRATGPDLYTGRGYFANSLLVDPENPDRLLAGSIFLWRSIDAGATWEYLETRTADGAFVHGYHMLRNDPAAGAIWAATDTGVYSSIDGGDSWVDHNLGLVTSEFFALCHPRSAIGLLYGATDNGFLRFEGTPFWSATEFGLAAVECQCDPEVPGHVYGMLGRGYAIASRDSLRTSDFILGGIHGNPRFVAPLALDPIDPSRLFTATSDGIFRTIDAGLHWDRVGAGNDIVSLSVSPVDPEWVWAQERSSGQVRVSRDGGESWTAHQAAPAPGIGGTKILADPFAADAAFCTYLHHPDYATRVLHTADGGATWSDVTGSLADQAVNTIAVDPKRALDWYVGTDQGVWGSRNGGATWKRYGRGLPNAQVLDLEFDERGPRFLLAATHGRGVWRVRPIDAFTSPSPRSRVRLEVLSQNPASDFLLFRYGATGGGAARLLVFDTAGRRVADLASIPADGRERLATWGGSQYAAGIYFVQVRAGSNRVTRKVVLVR